MSAFVYQSFLSEDIIVDLPTSWHLFYPKRDGFMVAALSLSPFPAGEQRI